MLRAIIKVKERDPHSGAVTESYSTYDFSDAGLEKILSGGGVCEDGYCVVSLEGIEILPASLADQLEKKYFVLPPAEH